MEQSSERLFELADDLKDLRDRKDALETELKQVNMDIENADWHLSTLMAETETQNFTRAGTMFCLTTKTRASAAEGRKDELYAALRAEGYGDLIYETVNATASEVWPAAFPVHFEEAMRTAILKHQYSVCVLNT